MYHTVELVVRNQFRNQLPICNACDHVCPFGADDVEPERLISSFLQHWYENAWLTWRGMVLEGLVDPLLETASDWVIHGSSYANYLDALGEEKQSEIYSNSLIDGAMCDALCKIRQFLMGPKGLTEDEGISLMSVATDFSIAQEVDGDWGVHGIIEKRVFAGDAG